MKPLAAIGIMAAALTLNGTAVGQEASPAGTESPTILIDAAHNDLIGIAESHSAWLEEEGFEVRTLEGPVDQESLAGVDVFVTAIPLASSNAVTRPWTDEKFNKAWQPPYPSAFSDDEVASLRQWVASGGAMALVFDHMPVSSAVVDLAAAFDIEVADGHAYDERLLGWDGGQLSRDEAGSAVFRRSDSTLASHPITGGRIHAERIDSVALGGGAALRLPPEGEPLLTLNPYFVSLQPEAAFQFNEDTPRQPIAGWHQGGVLRVGEGRLAVFSDAGILATHEEVSSQSPPWRGWQLQNPQLFLNTLRWLAREIEPPE